MTGCSSTIGKYSNRNVNHEFSVVQRTGETGEEFFLCAYSDECDVTPKSPFGKGNGSRRFTVGENSINQGELSNTIINEFLAGKALKIYFNFDSADIDKRAERNLNLIAENIKENNINRELVLLSSTDGFGTRLRNEVLAKERADSVKRIFIESGVKFKNVTVDKNVLCCTDLDKSKELVIAWRKFRSVTIALKD